MNKIDYFYKNPEECWEILKKAIQVSIPDKLRIKIHCKESEKIEWLNIMAKVKLLDNYNRISFYFQSPTPELTRFEDIISGKYKEWGC